jgi:ribokinase
MKSLNIDINTCQYKTMIGVGGIGSGMFFILNGNHTLGREESRSGRLENRKDYCKLHIISHYVKTLLGENFSVIPVGKVGKDDIGMKLLSEMKEAGLRSDFIELDENKPTLFSFCFIYPDKTGGNMTTNDSASSSVNNSFVRNVKKEFVNYANKGVALAAPEVPLEAREQLLQLGTEYGFFRAASFTSEEMKDVISSGILKKVDLLAINLDEASSVIKNKTGINESQTIVELSVKAFCSLNPKIKLSITHGKYGSWVWDGVDISHFPSLKVDVVSTAGAGDAFLSGIIAGITSGLSLKEAQQLGTLTGSASVTSPHTINKDMDREMLNKLMKHSGLSFSKKVIKLLED